MLCSSEIGKTFKGDGCKSETYIKRYSGKFRGYKVRESSFLQFLRDLTQTPPQDIAAPDNCEKSSKRLDAEAYRIDFKEKFLLDMSCMMKSIRTAQCGSMRT